MSPACKVCGTQMQLRNGRFGEFYFCVKSRVKNLHGTINKAEYDAASSATIIARDTADTEMLEHLHRIETAAADNAIDFYTDYQLSEDDEWPNILPKG